MDLPLRTYKKEFGHSYTFGVFPTLELVQHRPDAVLRVLVNEAGLKNRGVIKLEEACAQHRITFEVNTRLVERLAPKENAYVVGVFQKYEGTLRRGSDHVLLVNPSDMGNLGTIIRAMLGFGVTDLGILKPGADLFDPRVTRASMGALFAITCHYFDTFDDYRSAYLSNGRALYPFMTDGAITLSDVQFNHPFTLIFGNESAGLSPEYKSAGQSVMIPHSDAIDSLNLTIAVGIALYEAGKKIADNR